MLELLTVGRISVDLYADAPGAGFTDPQRFEKSIGGTATNVAVAAARLGHRSAVLTKVGADPFGDYVVAKLTSFGVDTSFVGRAPDPAHAAGVRRADAAGGSRSCSSTASRTAPDMQLEPGEVDAATLAEVAGAVGRRVGDGRGAGAHGGRGGARHPRPAAATPCSTSTTGPRSGRARRDGGRRSSARRSTRRPSPSATGPSAAVAVGTDEPDAAADRAARARRGGGDRQARRRRGARRHRRRRAPSPPDRVEVVCGLGAGDAFGGALVHGLLAGWRPQRTVEYANAAGAIVAGRLLCADAMPTDAEVIDLMRTPTGGPSVTALDDARTSDLIDARVRRTGADRRGARGAAAPRPVTRRRHAVHRRRRPHGAGDDRCRRPAAGDGRPALDARPPA